MAKTDMIRARVEPELNPVENIWQFMRDKPLVSANLA